MLLPMRVFAYLLLATFPLFPHPVPEENAEQPPSESGRLRVPRTGENEVDWQSVARQSALFTGIQHAFRVATEPGTRAGMKGPFFSEIGRAHV